MSELKNKGLLYGYSIWTDRTGLIDLVTPSDGDRSIIYYRLPVGLHEQAFQFLGSMVEVFYRWDDVEKNNFVTKIEAVK